MKEGTLGSEMMTDEMTNAIVQALNKNPEVHDWQIQKRNTSQCELYLIGQGVESSRKGYEETATVTIYHDREGKRGSTTLTFTPSQMLDVDGRIQRGVFAASLAPNPMHDLPGPAPYPDVKVQDPLFAHEPEKVMEKWRQEMISAIETEPQIRLSAAEFFIYNDKIDFLNSRGVSCSYPATRAFIEFVLLSKDSKTGSEEAENYHSLRVRSASLVDMVAIIRERASLARDMLKVNLPETWEGPVVITGDSLEQFLYPFVMRVRGDMLYRGIYKTKVGQSVFGEKPVTGDPLNLLMDSTMPYGVASAPIDSEGLPGRKAQVLFEGRVQSILASKRFADYLGLEANGMSGNIVVEPGSLSEAELLKGPVYHLVSFASMDPNPMTGEFASEIRLGYKVDSDGTRHPVKGGSVSGNVFDAFRACRMSRESGKSGSYVGPRSIRFDKLVIAGE